MDLAARQAWILHLVRGDGDVVYDPVDPDEAAPEISVRVKAPGGPLPHLGSMKYAERYRRVRGELALAEYAYGWWSQSGLGSLELHWHPLRWSRGESIHHVHCEPSGGLRGHFRGHRMELHEARDRFRELAASGRPNDCSGLYPF